MFKLNSFYKRITFKIYYKIKHCLFAQNSEKTFFLALLDDNIYLCNACYLHIFLGQNNAKYILYKILGKPAMVVMGEIRNDLSCPHVGDTHT